MEYHIMLGLHKTCQLVEYYICAIYEAKGNRYLGDGRNRKRNSCRIDDTMRDGRVFLLKHIPRVSIYLRLFTAQSCFFPGILLKRNS